MNLPVLGRQALGAARYRLTGRRAPLTAYLAVTNRCDALCTHCAIPMRAAKELPTKDLLALVDTLADRGCQALVLTGGEPLARKDLPEIVARAVSRGLFVTLETNGYQWPELAEQLPGVGRVVVGYEGPEAVHDELREPGAHAKAVAALEDAAKRGRSVSLLTTLSRHNVAVEALGDVLDRATGLGAQAEFRLLHYNDVLDGGASCELAPADASVRRALRWLIEARRQGRPVATTEKTLRTMLDWDDYRRPTSARPHEDQVCLAGQTHCYVDADGLVYTCRQRAGTSPGRSLKEGFDAAFDALRSNSCQACVAADLCERNHLDNLNLPTLFGIAANAYSGGRPGPG